jgi:hypothetical protein
VASPSKKLKKQITVPLLFRTPLFPIKEAESVDEETGRNKVFILY